MDGLSIFGSNEEGRRDNIINHRIRPTNESWGCLGANLPSTFILSCSLCVLILQVLLYHDFQNTAAMGAKGGHSILTFIIAFFSIWAHINFLMLMLHLWSLAFWTVHPNHRLAVERFTFEASSRGEVKRTSSTVRRPTNRRCLFINRFRFSTNLKEGR
jgi:hypothetical protein